MTIYEVRHGTLYTARFSSLNDAVAYAKGKKTDGGLPARVSTREIPQGTEKQWSVDSALPRRAPPPPRREAPPQEPEPEPPRRTRHAPERTTGRRDR